MSAKKLDIDAIRGQITALAAQREVLAGGPPLRADVRDALRRYVEPLAANAQEPMRRTLAMYRPSGRTLDGLFRVPMVNGGPVHQSYADMGGMLAAVMGVDGLLASLEPMLAAVPDGLSEPDRVAAVAALDAQLDRLEIAEEELIEESETSSAPIERRGNARPEIVLRLRA